MVWLYFGKAKFGEGKISYKMLNTMEKCGWLLLFPGAVWMVAVVSWWTPDGCCYFLVLP